MVTKNRYFMTELLLWKRTDITFWAPCIHPKSKVETCGEVDGLTSVSSEKSESSTFNWSMFLLSLCTNSSCACLCICPHVCCALDARALYPSKLPMAGLLPVDPALQHFGHGKL